MIENCFISCYLKSLLRVLYFMYFGKLDEEYGDCNGFNTKIVLFIRFKIKFLFSGNPVALLKSNTTFLLTYNVVLV